MAKGTPEQVKEQNRRYQEKHKYELRLKKKVERGDVLKFQTTPVEKFLRQMEKETVRGWVRGVEDRFGSGRRAARRRWRLKRPEVRRFYKAERRADKLRAFPNWANRAKIREIYRLARQVGLTVDHIVPLRSKTVGGLHCEANLQVLTNEENGLKSNRVWPDMP